MRRFKVAVACRGIAASIVVMLASLLAAGCTLVQPGCRNRDVKASIEQDARESLELTASVSKLAATAPDTKVSLVDQVEVDRHDNTRSCSGNVAVGVGGETVSVPIEYEVIVNADGAPLYRWDKYSFGKTLIGTALMSTLLDMAHAEQAPQHDEESLPPPVAQPDAAAAPEGPTPAAPAPDSNTAPFENMEAWKNEVRSEIASRAEKLDDMPKGRQRMRFRIMPDGKITLAKAMAPIGNPVLADRLVKFLNESDLVSRPLLNGVTWIDVTFSF